MQRTQPVDKGSSVVVMFTAALVSKAATVVFITPVTFSVMATAVVGTTVGIGIRRAIVSV